MAGKFQLTFLHGAKSPELVSTKFQADVGSEVLFCNRGKTKPREVSTGKFKWTSGVIGLCLVILDYKIHSDKSRGLDGEVGPFILSLYYSLAKEVYWLQDMFGLTVEGRLNAKDIINTAIGRPTKLRLYINSEYLRAEDVHISLEDSLCDLAGVQRIYRSILGIEDPKVNRSTISMEENGVFSYKLSGTSSPIFPRNNSELPLFFKNKSKGKVKAITYVPFDLGRVNSSHGNAAPYHNIGSEEMPVHLFDDGIAVAIIKREYECSDVVDFLLQRRSHHLDILSANSDVSMYLRSFQSKAQGQAGMKLPEHLLYVMSVHVVENVDKHISKENLCLMAEPSVLGVTDDPESNGVRTESIYTKDGSVPTEVLMNLVQQLDYHSLRYYITWANVIAEVRANRTDVEECLDRIEIPLQHLWYKLFQHSEFLRTYNKRIKSTVNTDSSIEVVYERGADIIREYSELTRVRPMGSTDLEALRLALIETSRIGSLFSAFKSLLGQLELNDDLQEVSRSKNG